MEEGQVNKEEMQRKTERLINWSFKIIIIFIIIPLQSLIKYIPGLQGNNILEGILIIIKFLVFLITFIAPIIISIICFRRIKRYKLEIKKWKVWLLLFIPIILLILKIILLYINGFPDFL